MTRSTAQTPAAKMPAAVVTGADSGYRPRSRANSCQAGTISTFDALAKLNKQAVDN